MEPKISKTTISNALLKICDIFKGKIDPLIYKDYILTMLFLKYLSDAHTEHREYYKKEYEGDEERIQRALNREQFVLDDKSTFDYMYCKRNESNIGEIINKVLKHIEEENKIKLQGVFKNIDFNSEAILGKTKDRNSILKRLLEDFKNIDLRPSSIENENVIGDVYEYMLTIFASEMGKKEEEFFTPPEVSELISRLVKPKDNDCVYDATIGTGSLAIRTAQKVSSGKVAIYGQEIKPQMYLLCKMNMFLHDFDDANIVCGDTISKPLFLEDGKLMKFQVIVSNPPFNHNKWTMGFVENNNENDFVMKASLDPYNRFEWGVPKKSKGDYAFVQHMLYSLADGGRMGIVLPHGVLFRGATERDIRKQIINLNLLDAVIGLPANLFFGTGIPACVLMFKKNRSRKNILFIDASDEEHYKKGKNQNNLREEDIQRIVDAYEKYEDIDKFAHVASLNEIKKNEYNLNIPRYVDIFDEEVPVDIDAVKQNIANIKNELAEIEDKIEKKREELRL